MDLFENGYRISDDPALLDGRAVHDFLTGTYWASERAARTQAIANRNSLCFGVYHGKEQVGFARVVTDYATFAYLADVYIAEPHRGRGLARRLVEAIQAHPRLQGLRRWMLATRDAHPLYAQCGWTALSHPERWMERFDAAANPPVAA